MKLRKVETSSSGNVWRVWCCKCESMKPDTKSFAVLDAAPFTYICDNCVKDTQQEGGR